MSVDIIIRDKPKTNAWAWFNIALRPRKPEGSLGRTAKDGHFDFHSAPELWFVQGFQCCKATLRTLDKSEFRSCVIHARGLRCPPVACYPQRYFHGFINSPPPPPPPALPRRCAANETLSNSTVAVYKDSQILFLNFPSQYWEHTEFEQDVPWRLTGRRKTHRQGRNNNDVRRPRKGVCGSPIQSGDSRPVAVQRVPS